jgi:hypothetical protein
MLKAIETAYGNKPLIGVEIGVFEGNNALSILTILNIKKLYLIDPYDEYIQFQARRRVIAKLKEAKSLAASRLDEYAHRIVWLYMKSELAVAHIEEQLDFVYIDGNHDYKYIITDIMKYSKLVKPDGFIGGHDYCIRGRPPIHVKEAVDDYIGITGLSLYTGDGSYPDWWVQIGR